MSSILTNNGAMVALQTLRGINDKMGATQNEISTGKSVATSKDNAAVWAISKVMESDVKGFEAISDSLNLGKSTVAVARNASESITDLLTEIKGKIVSSQEANVDRNKIQQDIGKLRDQISAVVGAAQFNGLNLVDGSAANPVKILSSLDRDASGGVKASKIDVGTVNLGTSSGTAAVDAVSASVSLADGSTTAKDSVTGLKFGDGTTTLPSASDTLKGVGGPADDSTAKGIYAGDVISYTVNNGTTDTKFSYTVSEGDTMTDVEAGLEASGSLANFSFEEASGVIKVKNTGSDALTVTAEVKYGKGSLSDLEGVDVTTDEGAKDALEKIEGMIQTSIKASSGFGSVEKRIEIQDKFISKLTDSLKAGIGSMVDADMEETSARLQALQVQQQLGTQSLSIANRAPQSLLSLFR